MDSPYHDFDFRFNCYSSLMKLFKKDEVIEFNKILRYSQQLSIDNFLKLNSRFLNIGKACIVMIISYHENEGNLFMNTDEDNWYKKIWGIIGNSKKTLKMNEFGFVTFNYDRSLDYFLYMAIKNSFNLSEEESILNFINIPIFHMHGKLGRFVMMKGYEHEPIINYNSFRLGEKQIQSGINAIKIIHENDNSQTLVHEAKRMIKSCSKLYFLGLAYHSENLELLDFNSFSNKGKHVAGTSLGFTDKELNQLRSKTMNKIDFKSTKSLDFLRNFADIN